MNLEQRLPQSEKLWLSSIDFNPGHLLPAELTSRQRVLFALNHCEPDRVPIDCGGRYSTMHVYTHRRLKNYFGLHGGVEVIRNYFVYQALVDERIRNRFQSDIILFEPDPPSGWELKINPKTNSYRDEWGVLYRMPPDGLYYDYYEHPLKNATIDQINNYAWPNPKDPGRFRNLKPRIEEAHKFSNKAIMLSSAIDFAWGHTQRLRGVEQALVDLVTNQKIIEYLADKITDWHKAHWEELLRGIGKYVDIIVLVDDYGGQNGPIFSPEVFRGIYKPCLKKLISFLHIHTDARIFLHSCGSIRWAIPDFIECGVEILNPVQVDAFDMETDKLKHDFGDQITFWGGGCDQALLATGLPHEIENEVSTRIQDLAPGGGYIFAPVHNIQPNVPPQNVIALYDSAMKYGRY
jgi:uroporphyrinogen decarboxylase